MSAMPDRKLADPRRIIVNLRRQLAECRAERDKALAERDEALEQQTASAEVLQVINSSPADLAPVFDAMLEKAARICQADSGFIFRLKDGVNRIVAAFGVPAEYYEFQACNPIPLGRGTLAGRTALERRAVHIVDAAADPEYTRAEAVQIGGQRTMLGVPLIREDALIGVITFGRARVKPFTAKQIALVSTFADQAVIAIENARLLTETCEALEQQTATAEVLQVINSSPGDLAPLFDAMLEKVMTLCEAAFGILLVAEGATATAAASRNVPEPFVEFLTRQPLRLDPETFLAQALQRRSVIHVPDAVAEEPYRKRAPLAVAAVELGGIRTMLMVPMLKDDKSLGLFTIYRQEVRPFTERQIAVVNNFAAQAVIAMENARLIDEIRQRQAELRVTFDHMGDGVVMFDQDLRLATWNRNFQELLDLPDAVLAPRPSYAEYLRILAERGELGGGDIEGELSRRLAETDRELRLERTRPGGRVIEVRGNVVPGGGFVLIYSDITERKEAEARLRAARDTAEGALRELRAAQANLIHAEKMASLGQLTAGIAHEIKNPLNFVNNFAGLSVELLDELEEAAAPAVASLGENERAEIDELVATLSGNLDKIAEHGRRADGIVTSMLLHSRGGSGERRQVDLNALVDEALNLAYHGARARDQSLEIVLERNFDRDARPIELVPQDMTRVLLNLIGNGFYAASAKGRAAGNGFRPVLMVTTCDLGEAVEIRVRDNGAGIPPEIRDRLFQPFFTTKPTGEGTGLGLSISWDIVTQQHDGTIEVDSRPGEFTEFTVRLPRPFFAAPNEKSAVSS
jgi:two-component system, NtrC family, sensor kinase